MRRAVANRLLPNVLYERITAGTATAARRAAALRRRGEKPSGNGRLAPSGPQLPPREQGGINPFLVLAGALAAGIVLAKLVEWRFHAHART
jgi:hypothetical protein